MASLLPAQPSRFFSSNHTPKTNGNSLPLYHFQKLKFFKAISVYPSDDSLSSIVDDNPNMPDSVKLAFAKAAAYRKNKLSKQSEEVEKALEESGTISGDTVQDSRVSEGSDDKFPAAEIIYGDPTKFGNLQPRIEQSENNVETEDGAMQDSRISEGSNGKNQQPSFEQSKDDIKTEDIYEPKVSTWGVFPRPSNISKAYGGGRVIRPGEALETEEDKKEKERRSKELIAAYESRIKKGLVVDPKIKAECETALNEGSDLMDRGRLRQAIPFFEKVMNEMIFESKLHGMAAFQLAVCLDSLQRSSEAKVMYEKLKNHPNYEVNTKARHFFFSFEAMDFMKVKSTYLSKTTGYETYFDSFVEGKNVYAAIKATQEDDSPGFNQILPYIVFMVSPIFVVLLIAARKSFQL